MTKNKQLILISLLVLLFFACKKDFVKYDRPTWLAGKLYTQILTKPELSTFAELLHVSGYDTIIDVSGSYTVFAPSNDAFTKYFQDNPKYKKVSDIPKSEVLNMVKYLLVQNAWSKKQLTSVDINGWIDSLDMSNNKPKGYKRETLLREKNRLYGVAWSKYKKNGDGTQPKRQDVIDTTATSWHRRVFTDARKNAPVFYKEYFDIYNLTASSDYAFYFGRQFEAVTDLYYVGAKIISDEIFAENGFIYVIDRVVEPLKSGAELLADNSSGNSYSKYLNLVNEFSEFTYNETETNKQAGAAQGKVVDSLFTIYYPKLLFNIITENTTTPKGTTDKVSNVTTRYHKGIVAPTNEALNQLESQYLAGGNNWGSIEAAPENIKKIIANSSLSSNPVYLTDVQKGFTSGENDIFTIDESSIVQKVYGSNCTFIGVNKPVVPRAFSSVTGPIYTRKGFSKVMNAIEKASLLSALKRKDANYSFFVERDELSSIDSSFIYTPGTNGGTFEAIQLAPQVKAQYFTVDDLRLLLLNHVATDRPKGMARKEFIKNLAGNFIIFNNVTGEVKGTGATTYGYKGVIPVVDIPQQISTNADNGVTYEISNWFSFRTTDLFSQISTNYPKFHQLIRKAGLSLDKLGKYTFMSNNQNYTVFAPTDSLLNTIDTNSLTTAQLKNFVMMHFVQGDLIFTDGNKQSGYYETARIDESSTPYTTINTKIRIETGVDQIIIPYKDGSKGVVVNESAKANVITGRDLDLDANVSINPARAFPNSMNNGVIHEIKKPLLFDQVYTK
jgi:uncharacterized surface protein with fasciclin (FAS1) repeats